MDPKQFRADLHRAADEVADYLERVADLPVLPAARPGDLLRALPASPPEAPEPFDQVLRDYREQIVPRLTHWNHPGFMAYFSSCGSEPGILGELLTAGTAVNAMLWQTSPAGTELEMRVCDWLRQMVGLPPELRGHITDTASTSTFLALAAARHEQVDGLRERGLIGRADLPPLVVYCGDQRHSSIDKAVMTLGLGLDQLRAIPADDHFALDPAALAAAIAEDRRAGRRPIAVVATVGSTSTTSVDPVAAIAEICAAEGLWLHVDAAWAGSGALCPELRHHFAGWERADSVVVNPHKWMFVPTDCSVLFVRGLERMRAAFALLPEYLRTADQESDDPDKPIQLMDLGFQLGRRFRSLKLWLVIRHYGVDGLRAILREHCRLGAELARWVDDEPLFERCAPTPFSTVCFRALLPGGDEAAHEAFNAQLLAAVNAQGPVYFGHTKLRGRYVLRVAISNLRTTEADVQLLWRLLRAQASSLRARF